MPSEHHIGAFHHWLTQRLGDENGADGTQNAENTKDTENPVLM